MIWVWLLGVPYKSLILISDYPPSNVRQAVTKYLIFGFLCTLSFISQAQLTFFKSLKARSISIESNNQQADFRDVGFDQFQNQARFGSFFEDPGSNYNWLGDQKSKSFNLLINFRMKDTTLYRHEGLIGIKKINQKVFWLQGQSSDYTQYKGRAELMKVLVGYRYYPIKRKRIKLSVGAQIDFGFTVSSFTKEKSGFGEYEYFGHKNIQGGIELPLIFQIRLFKGTNLYFGPAYGFGYFSQDGFGQVLYSKNFITGIRFDL